MISKSKVKLFQKYYRLNPNEFLEILEKWRTKSERQDKLLKEALTHLKTFWKLSSSKNKKILYSANYAYEINNFLKSGEKLTKRIEKEVAKIGVFE